MLEIAFEPAMGGDDRDRCSKEDQHLAERTETVGHDQSAEQWPGILRAAKRDDCGGDQQGDRDPGRDPRGAAITEGSDHHQRDRTDRQDGFGKDGGEVHQWASAAGVCVVVSALAAAGLPAVRCESPGGAARSIRSSRRPTSARIGRRKLSG